ncbi:MAG: hypothetical protein ABUS79_12755 [Pseudomonadota bacterium]
MLGLGTKLALVVGLVAVGAYGIRYHHRQNQSPRLGGAISRGKALWLSYAIFLWFIVCPALALDTRVPAALRIVLGSFGLSMWLRGLVELYLLYIGRGWRPPYGVGHDLFCLALIGVEAVWLRAPLALSVGDPLGAWTAALAVVVVISLILEVGYAWTFYRLVGERTVGAEAIWFASAGDPRFRTLVRATALANVPLCVFLALFLCATLR